MQLAKTAMLVSVNVINGGLLGERKDQKASANIQKTYDTADKRTKAVKTLIDRQQKTPKAVIAASQRVREVLYKYTIPWGDDKSRILSVKLADEFKVKLESAIADLKSAWHDYILDYPALVAASERAQTGLGELFDASQYPSQENIKDLFKVRVAFWPMPDSNHFIADISEASAKEAKEAIEREIEERLIEGTYDMVRRAKEVVAKFVDKLENLKFDDKGKSETIFRDSLVTNISETANLIEKMNITDNARIKKVVRDLNRLASFSPTSLRRSNISDRANEIRQKAITAGQEVLINLTMLDLKDQEVSDMVADTSDYMDM